MIYFIIWLVVFLISWVVFVQLEYISLKDSAKTMKEILDDPERLARLQNEYEQCGWAPVPSEYELKRAKEKITSFDSYYGIAVACFFWPAVVAFALLASLIIGAWLLGKYLIYIPASVIIYTPFVLVQKEEAKFNLIKKLVLKLHKP